MGTSQGVKGLHRDFDEIEAARTVFVGLCRDFSLIKGARLATEGQLAPSYARDKSGASFGQACQQFPVDEVALPFLAQQVELAAAGDDVVENDQGIRGRGGLPSIAYHPRHEDCSPEALVARGDATHGTPEAPWGRLCRSNGSDEPSDSRHYGCGLPCPPQARERCPHGQQARGSTHRMCVPHDPRLMGPLQRGPEAWKIL